MSFTDLPPDELKSNLGIPKGRNTEQNTLRNQRLLEDGRKLRNNDLFSEYKPERKIEDRNENMEAGVKIVKIRPPANDNNENLTEDRKPEDE